MGEQKFPHPFKRVRRLLRRIRNPRLRMAAVFGAFFIVNLAAGRLVETVFDKDALARAYAAQAGWIAALERFSPLELGRGYLADFGPASRGEIVYRRPVIDEARAAKLTAAFEADAERRQACLAARLGQTARPCAPLLPPGETASTCTVSPDSAGCAAYLECESRTPGAFSMTPPECVGLGLGGLSLSLEDGVAGTATGASESKAVVPAILAPLAALVRTVTRQFSGGWSALVPILQLGLGAIGAFALMRDRKGAADGDGIAMILISPLIVIAIASFGALALKWLMIGALGGFAWITHFAAAAAGATGFLGACWYCLSKLAEKGVEGALTGKIV